MIFNILLIFLLALGYGNCIEYAAGGRFCSYDGGSCSVKKGSSDCAMSWTWLTWLCYLPVYIFWSNFHS
ncbi:hypothetical protein SLEP1_g7364 [Rubroshorea leprosula]|uniref:Uncharacterized protein n=1 Tax=Rubroshorea leprosula TaxID=152421 RepID=A0AAV5I458_9ROSI|nr:hypothetical protein SLEP1_g7364 [Rubroshorea leprosula]